MNKPEWIVSPITADDLGAVHNIEQQTPSPWSMSQLEGDFFTTTGLQLICRLAVKDQICGFIIGRTVADEAEILKIATDHDYRRRGAAEQLIRALLSLLMEKGIKNCHLELRSANLPARRLYEKFDFLVTGSRKNYYTDPDDDAVCMLLNIQDESHTQKTDP
jgi:ribosomal-protein-alanine N-acetyltransferase